jgi:hypothetical protein
MKKALLTLAAIGALAASSFGQGTVIVAYSTGPNTVKQNGVSAAGTANIRIEVLWAPAGTTDLGLFTPIGAQINVGVPTPGYFSGGTRTIAGIAPGASVAAYARAWDNDSGATYAAATQRGISPLFVINTADPTAVPAEPAVNLNAVFPGVDVTAVPEPSSMALAGLGAASLLIFRRRK